MTSHHRDKQKNTGLKKIRPLLLICLCVLLAAAGCGKTDETLPDILSAEEDYGTIAPEEVNDGNVPGEAPSDPVTEVSDSSSASDNGRNVVYLILPTDTGFSAIEKELITETLIKSGYGVAVRFYNDDITQQTNAFAEALHTRPAAIVCDNIYGDETRTSVLQAKEARVPVFLMDQGIDLSGVAQGQLVVDRCGRAEDLARYFVERSSDPVNYVMLGGCEKDSRSLDMTDIIARAMNRYVQVTQLAEECQETYDGADAEMRIRDLLVSYPEVNALICYNTLQTKAGLKVLEELGLKDRVRVLCVSGDRDEIVTLIEDGEVEAAVVEPPETLASMVTDDVFLYFRTGSPQWSERRYVMAKILTEDGYL